MAKKREDCLMDWGSLQLWAEEEKRIHACLVEALEQLIASQFVTSEDGELIISGKLRPHLFRAKKKLKLAWKINVEVATFANEDSPKPFGFIDIRFSGNTPDFEQYDYDVECKLVRIKRQGKSHDYCKYYVTDGVKRFQDGIYAQSMPPLGTIIGYVQEGELIVLLKMVNDMNCAKGFDELQLQEGLFGNLVLCLTQQLLRDENSLLLTHLWADFR